MIFLQNRMYDFEKFSSIKCYYESEYYMSKKSWPILDSNLQYTMSQDFLDVQYTQLMSHLDGKSVGTILHNIK